MSEPELRCALVADLHHGMSEGVRGLLATMFKTVVMVADEASLFASADLLHSELAVVDLALSRGEGLELVRRLRGRFPDMKLIIISVHEPVEREPFGPGGGGQWVCRQTRNRRRPARRRRCGVRRAKVRVARRCRPDPRLAVRTKSLAMRRRRTEASGRGTERRSKY